MTLSGPELIEALAVDLESDQHEVERLDDGEGFLLFIPLDEWFDVEEDAWFPFDGVVIITVWLMLSDDRDEPIKVIVETPPMTNLGAVGHLIDHIDETDGMHADTEQDDDQAILLLGWLAAPEPDEGVDVVGDAVRVFFDIVGSFGSTGLRFASFEEEEAGVPTPGFAELQRGVDVGEGGDYPTSVELLEQASHDFELAGLRRLRLIAETALTSARILVGESMVEGRRQLEAIEAEVAEIDDDKLQAMIAGYVADLYQAVGDPRAAAAAYERSKALDATTKPSQLRDMVDMRDPRKASALAIPGHDPKSRAVLKQDPLAAAEQMLIDSVHALRLGDNGRAIDLLADAADLYERSDQPDSLFGALAQLATVYASVARRDDAIATFERLKRVEISDLYRNNPHNNFYLLKQTMAAIGADTSDFEAPRKRSQGVFQDFMDVMEETAEAQAAGDYETQLQALERTHRLVETMDDPMASADSLAKLARFRITQAVRRVSPDFRQEAKQALDELIEAIAIHDHARHRLASVGDRSRFMEKMLGSYELAIITAMGLTEDHALVAELLERIRVLGVPDHAELAEPSSTWLRRPTAAADGSESTSAEGAGEPPSSTYNLIASLGVLPVTEPPHTSIGGHSRLSGEDSSVVSLEDRIASQAGPDAWWWSMWSSESTLFWATRSPDGDFQSHALSFDPDRDKANLTEKAGSVMGALLGHHFNGGPLGRYLDQLRQDIWVGSDPGNTGRSDGVGDPFRGLLGDNAAEERELLRQIGDLLIPDPLRQALQQSSRHEPLRLLVSPAPSLSWMPLLLLGLPDRSGRTIRLVERAVVQYMSPLDLSSSSGVTPDPAEEPTGILAIVDPTDDLAEMHPLGAIASTLLAGRRWPRSEHSQPVAVADRDAVLETFRSAERFKTLLFAGHGEPARSGDPLSAGLRLSGSADRPANLTVADLLATGHDLELPSVAILCACSTAGHLPTPGTERWGLPGALLLAGSRSVIATSWDLVSCRATATIAGRLAMTASGSDAPEVLRDLQLELLDAWQGDVAAGATIFDPESPDNHQPYLWAPFIAMASRVDHIRGC